MTSASDQIHDGGLRKVYGDTAVAVRLSSEASSFRRVHAQDSFMILERSECPEFSFVTRIRSIGVIGIPYNVGWKGEGIDEGPAALRKAGIVDTTQSGC